MLILVALAAVLLLVLLMSVCKVASDADDRRGYDDGEPKGGAGDES